MTRRDLTALLDVEPPAGWTRRDIHSGITIIPEEEVDDVVHTKMTPSRALWIGSVATEGHATDAQAIDAIMRRRVPQGIPEELSGQVDGRRALALGWTDGVSYIVSMFVYAPTGELESIS